MRNDEALHCWNHAAKLFPSMQVAFRRDGKANDAAIREWLKAMKPYDHDAGITGIERFFRKNTHYRQPTIDDFVQAIDDYVNEVRPSEPRTDAGTLDAAVGRAPTAGDMLIAAGWCEMVSYIMAHNLGHDPLWIAERCEQYASEQPQLYGYWTGQARKHYADASRTQAPVTSTDA